MRQNANKMPIADQGRKNVQELDSIGVVDEYRHACNSAGHYMIQRTIKLNSCGPSHKSILSHCSSNNNKNEK